MNFSEKQPRPGSESTRAQNTTMMAIEAIGLRFAQAASRLAMTLPFLRIPVERGPILTYRHGA